MSFQILRSRFHSFIMKLIINLVETLFLKIGSFLLQELEPFPEIDIFDGIRQFHQKLCQAYSPRDHLLKVEYFQLLDGLHCSLSHLDILHILVSLFSSCTWPLFSLWRDLPTFHPDFFCGGDFPFFFFLSLVMKFLKSEVTYSCCIKWSDKKRIELKN